MYFRLCWLLMLILACSGSSQHVSETISVNSAKDSSGWTVYPPLSALGNAPFPADSLIDSTLTDNMMLPYSIVVADTSMNYYQLRQTMLLLSEKTGIMIDSLGRYYDAKKGIILPADCGDEIYANSYYPRRFESADLSIEYFKEYVSDSNEKLMAIVAGQYTNKYLADKQLRKIKAFCPQAYIIQSVLYNGCMH